MIKGGRVTLNTLKPKKKVNGISANALVLPVAVVVGVLHLAVIMVIFSINSSSTALSTIMQNSADYMNDATSLLGGSSLLSETSSNFVLMPVTEAGQVNVGPLTAYAGELDNPRRGDQVIQRFRGYDVSEEAFAMLSTAAVSADAMLSSQLHAISLVRAVYPLPEDSAANRIPLVELTEEEKAMTGEEKMAAARLLILGTEYGLNKQSVSQNVNACVNVLHADSARKAAETSARLQMLRTLMWVFILTIVGILIATFIALYTQLLHPLRRFAGLISSNRSLDEKKGMREIRLLAHAYNSLLKRRDALDAILRSAAETDALTKLPNRYGFEQYVLDAAESGSSTAVLLFDINYLKQTNDSMGHSAGDNLIRSAAECISACFGEHCFRFGGDEFAAVVRNCTPETIRQRVARFEQMEKERNVSISFGYAYTDDIGRTTIKKLLDEADKKMYKQKEEAHKAG